MSNKHDDVIGKINEALLAARERMIAHVTSDEQINGSLTIEIPFSNGSVRIVKIRECFDLAPWAKGKKKDPQGK